MLLTLVNVYVDLVVFTVLPVLHRPEVVDIGVNTCIQDGTHKAHVVQWDAGSYIQESEIFLSIPQ